MRSRHNPVPTTPTVAAAEFTIVCLTLGSPPPSVGTRGCGHASPASCPAAGTFRANWRDANGRQKAKTFPTRRQAAAFLAETETAIARGGYVDPHAGRLLFGKYAERWRESRNDELTTRARDASILRTHVCRAGRTCPYPGSIISPFSTG
ncbi:hypothetical protein GCM10027259_59220 [Micromonospora palomenae]